MRFDSIPIWAIFAATFLIVMGAIEAGYRLGGVAHRRSEEVKESPVSAIAGAVLGLAAFMLAFTFGIVWELRGARKELVRQEAVALRAAWQRSDFLPEGDRDKAAALLHQYVDLRVAFAEAGRLEPSTVRRFLSDTQRLEDQLWNMAVANARKDMNSDVAALYIESLNEVSGIHATRVTLGLQERLPTEIWIVLYGVTILGMMVMGYQTGIAAARRSMGRPNLAVSFALVFALIASIERPDSGVLSVSQRPLVDLRDAMAAAARRAPGH